MKLGDKAEEPPDVTLNDDILESYYRLLEDNPDLVPADELTPEGDFPQYGDFLEVEERSPVDGTMRGKTWLLISQDLARWLVEEETSAEDWWIVKDKEMVDGTWQFDCERVSDE